MVKNPHDDGTYDEWWQWLVKKLTARTWKSNPTKQLVLEFCRGYTLGWRGISPTPLAAFLSAKSDALSPQLRDRLRTHLIEDVDVMAKQNEPAMRALLDKLGVERGLDYLWTRVRGGYTPAQIAELDDIARKQFLAMAGQHYNRTFRAPAAFFRDYGTDPEPNVTRWRISAKSEPKTPLYEMWSILKGSGSIFRAGDIEPVAYLIARQCFRGDTKLVADLQPSMPWPVT